MEKNRHKDPAAKTPTRRSSDNNSGHSDLQAAKQLFDLIHHRNKNQHRHSIWWRHFAALRRAVGKLVQDAGEQEDGEDKVCARARFVDVRLIPKCYLSFTQLVHDNQFSALGLVLLATLARVRRACSDLLASSAPTEEEDDFMITARATSPGTDTTIMTESDPAGGRRGDEDTGEIVLRTEREVGRDGNGSLFLELTEDIEKGATPRPSRTPTKAPVPAAKAAKGGARKERRRRSNAIDALFQGLA